MPLPFRHALIVANPVAGRGRAQAAAHTLAQHIYSAGLSHELHFTAARGDGKRLVRERAGVFDVVVAIGGDGTVREVLDGLVDPSVPVMIFALGTANVMSLDLALPRDPEGVARCVLAGRTTAIDVARVNGEQLSFLVTGVGFDAQVVAGLERLRKGPITKGTWARAGVSAFLFEPLPRLSVTLDGRAIEGEWAEVLFANVVHYGGYAVLAEDRVLDDGLWELYLFPARTRLGLLKHAAHATFGRFPGGGVRRERGRKLAVHSLRSPPSAPVPVQVDGDLATTTPIVIELERVQRRLVLP
ncbi:MAG: NAD(+)/NADH kinase [Planctomycetes bacterium]|nr:NAD(+)/NADH kinase [Planctomycetota bacterium]